MRPSQFVLLTGLSVFGMLPCRTADACSPPYCTKGYFAPADGVLLTTSAPSLFYQPGRINGPQATDAGVPMPTLWSSGQELACTASEQPDGTWLLTPSQALKPSVKYEVRYVEPCTDQVPSDAGPAEVVQTFTAGVAAAAPTAVGTLSAWHHSGLVTVMTSSGSCTTSLWAGVADIKVAFDDSLKPYLPTTMITTRVDGEIWATSPYGVDDVSLSTHPMAMAARRYDRIFGACWGEGTPSDDRGVAEGGHTVELQAHVAGATSDPPAQSIEIYLICSTSDDVIVADGGWHDAGGVEAGSGALPDSPESDGGCALSSFGSGSVGIWLFALGALTFALVRRGRRQV